jgi:hypothetical protein
MKDVIELAREAGFEIDCVSLEWHRRIERFAHLVRAEVLEETAGVCEDVSFNAMNDWNLHYKPLDQGRELGADECAAAIRALKEKT